MTDVVYSVDVRVSAPVQPTEVTDRVVDAVLGLFPNADVDASSERVVAEAHSVETFREQLFEQRILDTARKQFLEHRDPEGFSFDLKKQAAFNGKVNFAVGSPDELGDVHVDVSVAEPDVDEFIDYLAPETEGGEPPEL
ncbi:MAG: coaE operon protein [Halobacterium sp.]